MTKDELKQKVDANNKVIEEFATPSFFTLNKKVMNAISENFYLRSICDHEFENGFCKYCYLEDNNG